MEPLLTPKTLAALLGIAEQTIYNRHSTGGDLPPAVKIGRRLRFRAEDVSLWVESKRESVLDDNQIRYPAPAKRGRPRRTE